MCATTAATVDFASRAAATRAKHIPRATLALAAALLLAHTAAALPARPTPAPSRVLLISIDGLRPDLLLRAKTPVLRDLMARGSYSMWARTTAVAVTLPSHVSMLTGVIPAKHDIEWNTDLPLQRPIYPSRPTLFELAHKAGYTTAMAAGKSKFSALAVPGALDRSYVPTQGEVADEAVADTVVRWINTGAPQLLFVHLADVDLAGHDHGWGSKEQIAAIATADRCVSRVLESIRGRRLLDSTLVLITSDHGGAGRSHGADDTRSRMIPWIVAGPGLCRDLDLTRYGDLDIRTEDTFATICWLLGLDVPKPIDGHPVTQIVCEAASGPPPRR